MRLHLPAIGLLALLSGCDDAPTIREICQEQPQFCADLNQDSHCRVERSVVIFDRVNEAKDPSDDNKFKLITSLEDYRDCVEVIKDIEHIKLKEKKSSRVEGYMNAQKELTRLYRETQDSDHPGLLYYRWSRKNDIQALEQFLALADSEQMQTEQMQFFLATYFVKENTEKTIDHLYKSLEYHQADTPINLEVLTTLSNIFYQQEKYKYAYVWGKVAMLAGAENVEFAPIQFQASSQGLDLAALDALAQTTFEQIDEGQFFSPRDY